MTMKATITHSNAALNARSLERLTRDMESLARRSDPSMFRAALENAAGFLGWLRNQSLEEIEVKVGGYVLADIAELDLLTPHGLSAAIVAVALSGPGTALRRLESAEQLLDGMLD